MVINTHQVDLANRLIGSLIVAVLSAGCAQQLSAPPITASPVPPAQNEDAASREVVLVGNNWAGTVVAFDPNPPFSRLATFDVVPDHDALMQDVARSPRRQVEMALIRKLAGENHDQLVDDVFTSPDGRYLYASRPSYKDVVALDLTSPGNPIPHWRMPVEGKRADHAAISADGSRLLVSASTANKVHEIDTATGRILRSFPSGDEPHESNYSHDQTKIFHASIGRVFLPTTSNALDRLKGKRWFEIVDARSFKVLDRFDMGEKAKESGREWKDSAVRPMAISADDKFIYFQVSFLHGFYKFDVEQKKVVDRKILPDVDTIEHLSNDEYQLNSADHGITINGDGTKLCIAGTLTGKAYIVHTDSLEVSNTIDLHDDRQPGVAPKPYWSTTSADGKNCYLSLSQLNKVVIISFTDEKLIGSVDVGPPPAPRQSDLTVVHPQRVRNGRILESALPSVTQRSAGKDQ